MQIVTRKLPIDDPEVVARIEDKLSHWSGHIQILEPGRRNRSHLRPHKDRGGYYVRIGRRGKTKLYLAGCHISSFDGKPVLYQFHY